MGCKRIDDRICKDLIRKYHTINEELIGIFDDRFRILSRGCRSKWRDDINTRHDYYQDCLFVLQEVIEEGDAILECDDVEKFVIEKALEVLKKYYGNQYEKHFADMILQHNGEDFDIMEGVGYEEKFYNGTEEYIDRIGKELSQEEMKFIKLLFGIGCRQMSIGEIAVKYNTNDDKVKKLFALIRSKLNEVFKPEL